MKRTLLACFARLLTWIVVVSVIDRGLRLVLPDYTAAEHTLQFTLSMKWAWLLMSIVTSITAGAVTRWVAPLSDACGGGTVVLLHRRSLLNMRSELQTG